MVIAERDSGAGREVRVHYAGWKKKWDEWLPATCGRLKPLPANHERKRGLALLQEPSIFGRRTMAKTTASSSGGSSHQAGGPAGAAPHYTDSTQGAAGRDPRNDGRDARRKAEKAAAAESASKRAADAAKKAFEATEVLRQLASEETDEALRRHYEDLIDTFDASARRAQAGAEDAAVAAKELLAAESEEGDATALDALDLAPAPARGRGRGRGLGGRGRGRKASADPYPLADSLPPQPLRGPSFFEGERVRAESETMDDGDYERCGIFGCILRIRHGGLCIPADDSESGRGVRRRRDV